MPNLIAFRVAASLCGLGFVAWMGPHLTACGKFEDECHTAIGEFAASYKMTQAPAGSGCNADLTKELTSLKGDVLGFQWYEFDHFARDPKKDKNTVAVQSNSLGLAVRDYASSRRKAPGGAPGGAKDTIATHTLYALGTFTTPAPDSDSFCRVDALQAAEQVLPEVPGAPEIKPNPAKPGDTGAPALPPRPALSVKYEWSNMRVYVDPVVSGGEIAADLAYTKNGCTAKYKVLAVYPVVPCLDKATKKPRDVDCDPQARPEQGHPVGSGLKASTRCDADLGFCVLAKDDIP